MEEQYFQKRDEVYFIINLYSFPLPSFPKTNVFPQGKSFAFLPGGTIFQAPLLEAKCASFFLNLNHD